MHHALKSLLVGTCLAAALGAGGISALAEAEDAQPLKKGKKIDPNCGGEDNPCPLEAWMNANVKPAVEEKNLKDLAEALDKISGFAPNPAWNKGPDSWSAIAKEGAKQARAGDFKAARKSCKGCHKPWRKKYNKKYKTRPVPKH